MNHLVVFKKYKTRILVAAVAFVVGHSTYAQQRESRAEIEFYLQNNELDSIEGIWQLMYSDKTSPHSWYTYSSSYKPGNKAIEIYIIKNDEGGYDYGQISDKKSHFTGNLSGNYQTGTEQIEKTSSPLFFVYKNVKETGYNRKVTRKFDQVKGFTELSTDGMILTHYYPDLKEKGRGANLTKPTRVLLKVFPENFKVANKLDQELGRAYKSNKRVVSALAKGNGASSSVEVEVMNVQDPVTTKTEIFAFFRLYSKKDLVLEAMYKNMKEKDTQSYSFYALNQIVFSKVDLKLFDVGSMLLYSNAMTIQGYSGNYNRNYKINSRHKSSDDRISYLLSQIEFKERKDGELRNSINILDQYYEFQVIDRLSQHKTNFKYLNDLINYVKQTEKGNYSLNRNFPDLGLARLGVSYPTLTQEHGSEIADLYQKRLDDIFNERIIPLKNEISALPNDTSSIVELHRIKTSLTEDIEKLTQMYDTNLGTLIDNKADHILKGEINEIAKETSSIRRLRAIKSLIIKNQFQSDLLKTINSRIQEIKLLYKDHFMETASAVQSCQALYSFYTDVIAGEKKDEFYKELWYHLLISNKSKMPQFVGQESGVQQIRRVLDYGREWEFDIELLEIEKLWLAKSYEYLPNFEEIMSKVEVAESKGFIHLAYDFNDSRIETNYIKQFLSIVNGDFKEMVRYERSNPSIFKELIIDYVHEVSSYSIYTGIEEGDYVDKVTFSWTIKTTQQQKRNGFVISETELYSEDKERTFLVYSPIYNRYLQSLNGLSKDDWMGRVEQPHPIIMMARRFRKNPKVYQQFIFNFLNYVKSVSVADQNSEFSKSLRSLQSEDDSHGLNRLFREKIGNEAIESGFKKHFVLQDHLHKGMFDNWQFR